MTGAAATTMRWRRRGRAAVVFALVDLALFNAFQVFASHNRWPDFAFFYTFAKAGLTDGYAHLYDPGFQERWVQTLFPGAPFYVVVNPPPFAWLLLPLVVLPFTAALVIWTVGMIASLAGAAWLLAPPKTYMRVVFTGSWLAYLPAFLVFVSAPLAPLVILSAALAFKYVQERREVVAGVVLAVGLVKPTLALLVPFALLAAGHRKTFVAWLAAAAVLVATSVAVLGQEGVSNYAAVTRDFAANPYYLRWSLVPILGEGPVWVAGAAAIAAATMALAWRLRRSGAGVTVAVGVMGSVLVNHHMTPGDLMMLLLPMWLLARESRGLARDGMLVAAWIMGWLSLPFPVLALVVAGGVPLWLLGESALRQPSVAGHEARAVGAPAR